MSILLSLLGFGKIVGGWIKSLPWWAPVGAVVLIGGYILHRGAERRAFDSAFNVGWSQQHRLLVQEQRARAIDLASIGRLNAALDQKNAETEARAKAFADSKASDAKAVASADTRQKADAGRRAMLQGLADHATANPSCAAPKALTDSLGGI